MDSVKHINRKSDKLANPKMKLFCKPVSQLFFLKKCRLKQFTLKIQFSRHFTLFQRHLQIRLERMKTRTYTSAPRGFHPRGNGSRSTSIVRLVHVTEQHQRHAPAPLLGHRPREGRAFKLLHTCF